MKSVENILGYIPEQFLQIFEAVSLKKIFEIVQEYMYTKMFKTDSFFGNKKLSLNQNVWRDQVLS